MELLELSLRWIFAMQMIFWGLNGFFNWLVLPPSGPVINQFSQACVDTKFIMPTVKVLEILLGLSLLLNFSSSLCLLLFAPLMFVITGLHVFHNPRPWSVLAPLVLPYILLLFFHGSVLLRLIH